MHNLQQNKMIQFYSPFDTPLEMWCAKKSRIKLNPEKAKVIIFSRSSLARNSESILKLYGERLKIYPEVKFLGSIFDSKFTFQNTLRKSWGLQHQVSPNQTFSQQKMGTQPVHILHKQCVRPIFEHSKTGIKESRFFRVRLPKFLKLR